MSAPAGVAPTPIQEHTLKSMARGILRAFSLPYDHIDDLVQVARQYELEHPDDQWWGLNIPRHMRSYASYWLYQAKRSTRKGLRAIAEGETDESWLNTHAPNVAGHAMARVTLARMWNGATAKQRLAILALIDGEYSDKGHGIQSSDLARFGISDTKALYSRLRAIREKCGQVRR